MLKAEKRTRKPIKYAPIGHRKTQQLAFLNCTILIVSTVSIANCNQSLNIALTKQNYCVVNILTCFYQFHSSPVSTGNRYHE